MYMGPVAETMPVIVMKNDNDGWTVAHVARDKDASDKHIVKALCEDIEWAGESRFTFKAPRTARVTSYSSCRVCFSRLTPDDCVEDPPSVTQWPPILNRPSAPQQLVTQHVSPIRSIVMQSLPQNKLGLP